MPAKKISNLKSQISKVKSKKPVKAAKKVTTKKSDTTVSEVLSKTHSRKTSPKTVKSLTIDVYDTKGKQAGSLTLPKPIFGATVNIQLMAQSVRVYLANQRKGNVSTKTRGEVDGSTRKIWKQKGTGRARHGAITAPIFVGGGVAFGPKPRDYSLMISKKMKKAALFSALSSKLQEGSITVVSGLEKIAPKTKEIVNVLTKLSIEGNKKHILLIIPDTGAQNVHKAARNIQGVDILPMPYINTYEVLRNDKLIFMQPALEAMQKYFLKEEK